MEEPRPFVKHGSAVDGTLRHVYEKSSDLDDTDPRFPLPVFFRSIET